MYSIYLYKYHWVSMKHICWDFCLGSVPHLFVPSPASIFLLYTPHRPKTYHVTSIQKILRCPIISFDSIGRDGGIKKNKCRLHSRIFSISKTLWKQKEPRTSFLVPVPPNGGPVWGLRLSETVQKGLLKWGGLIRKVSVSAVLGIYGPHKLGQARLSRGPQDNSFSTLQKLTPRRPNHRHSTLQKSSLKLAGLRWHQPYTLWPRGL